MKRAAALLFVLVFCTAQSMWPRVGPASRGAGGGGGGGTDFTATVDFCYFMASTGTEAEQMINRCSVTGQDLTATHGSATTFNTTPPTGATSGQLAITGDGSMGYRLADQGANPTSFAMGCWVNDASSNDTAFAHGTGGNMRFKNSTQHVYDAGVTVGLTDATVYSDAWHHVAVIYDSTDAGATSAKLLVNGTVMDQDNGTDPSGTDDGTNPGFFFGSDITGGADWNGTYYECFLDFAYRTPSEICQIATTGLRGTATHTPGCTP